MQELHFQLAALHQLKAHNFPGAFPYATKSSPTDFIAVLSKDAASNGKELKALLFDFLPGRPGEKATMNVNKAIELGKALAKLHSIPAPSIFIETRPRFPPGLADIEPFMKNDLPKLDASLQQHDFVRKYLGGILPKCRPFLELSELPRGIVHGDIFPDN
jgi:Ser/Thr protein kinase RdoA (MazF antagonist)